MAPTGVPPPAARAFASATIERTRACVSGRPHPVVRTPDLGLELWPRAHQDDGYRWRLVLDRRDLTRIGRVEVVDHPRLRVQANLSANQRANLADLHPESFDRLSDDFALLRQRFPKVLEYREREWVSLGG